MGAFDTSKMPTDYTILRLNDGLFEHFQEHSTDNSVRYLEPNETVIRALGAAGMIDLTIIGPSDAMPAVGAERSYLLRRADSNNDGKISQPPEIFQSLGGAWSDPEPCLECNEPSPEACSAEAIAAVEAALVDGPLMDGYMQDDLVINEAGQYQFSKVGTSASPNYVDPTPALSAYDDHWNGPFTKEEVIEMLTLKVCDIARSLAEWVNGAGALSLTSAEFETRLWTWIKSRLPDGFLVNETNRTLTPYSAMVLGEFTGQGTSPTYPEFLAALLRLMGGYRDTNNNGNIIDIAPTGGQTTPADGDSFITNVWTSGANPSMSLNGGAAIAILDEDGNPYPVVNGVTYKFTFDETANGGAGAYIAEEATLQPDVSGDDCRSAYDPCLSATVDVTGENSAEFILGEGINCFRFHDIMPKDSDALLMARFKDENGNVLGGNWATAPDVTSGNPLIISYRQWGSTGTATEPQLIFGTRSYGKYSLGLRGYYCIERHWDLGKVFSVQSNIPGAIYSNDQYLQAGNEFDNGLGGFVSPDGTQAYSVEWYWNTNVDFADDGVIEHFTVPE